MQRGSYILCLVIWLCFVAVFHSVPPLTSPALAVTAEEQLADPELEKRARNLSKELRCLVCQNQSIDDSDAELAKDLRIEVRKQLLTGAEDKDILRHLQSKYGDYVLLNPPVKMGTLFLWLAPVLALLIGGGLIALSRSSKTQKADIPTDESLTLSDGDRHWPKSTGNRSPVFLISCLAVLVLGATGLYWFVLGRPELHAQPLAARSSEIAQSLATNTQQMEQKQKAFDRAKEEIEKKPNNVGAWLAYALRAAELGQVDIEIEAIRTALSLSDDNPAIQSMLAEALTRSADGQVLPEARTLIANVLAQTPDDPRALFLAGLAAMQDSAYPQAIEKWERLIQLSEPDALWVPVVLENLREAAQKAGIDARQIPALSEAQLADITEMSDAEREEMIEGMVLRLRERLDNAPEDSAGWLRLVQAYDVLNRPDDALYALGRAAEIVKENRDVQISVLQRLLSHKRAVEHIELAKAALARLSALNPQDPEYLFFAGHFARLEGQNAQARRLWESLLSMVPEDGEIALLLRAEINKLSAEPQN